MRYLGMDLGSKTLGLAISDVTGVIATSYRVLRYNEYGGLLSELDEIIKNEKIEKIVLGDPLNLDGSVSVRSEETYKFKTMLEDRYNLEVFLQDERLTTTQAERMLIDNNTSRKKRKKVIDKIAAVIILQSYLDRKDK